MAGRNIEKGGSQVDLECQWTSSDVHGLEKWCNSK